jgi:uncharacterized radical SAM superfamily Fe-S cluster-containing enzyme
MAQSCSSCSIISREVRDVAPHLALCPECMRAVASEITKTLGRIEATKDSSLCHQ